MLNFTELYDLAPTDLPNRRADRFDGRGFGLDLAAFGPADRARLARLYAMVDNVYRPLAGARAASPRERLLALDGAALVRDASALGSDTPPEVTREPRVRRLLHDIRGGGLQLLLGTAELLQLNPAADDLVPNALSAARDHAKIMRAGFPALDPETYTADEEARVHAIDGFVTTWDGLSLKRAGRSVAVTVECEYRGAITGRCLETASIDRIMYNYMNNAMRFAADGKVAVWIFLAGSDLVRWVVHNTLSEDHRAWLDRATGNDSKVLFHGGLTQGGNGIGLSGCAEIVAECFGVEPTDALRAGHLGARADATGFTAWFHWPVYGAVNDAEAQKAELCECHV